MRDRLKLSMQASHVFMAVFAIGAVLCALWGAAVGDSFYLRLGTEALILAGLAMSVELLLGYSGLLSLGQALYFGAGAYVSALVLRETPSFWLAMGAAFGFVLLLGIIGGLIANRVRGVYFALITFGMAQVAAKTVYNTRELGGSDGLIGVPQIDVPLGIVTVSAADPMAFFLFVLGFMIALYLMLAYLLGTPFGRVLTAMKANEKRVPFLGYSTWRARMAAYVVAAVVAGVSGALYPMLRGFVSPELMFFETSGDALIMAVVGGLGTLVGAFYGAALITGLKSVIGSWTEHHLIVIGALFVAAILFMPKGLIGRVRPWIEAMFARERKPATELQEESP